MKTTLNGCAALLVALGIVVVLVVSGVDSLARSFADWRVAQAQVMITEINADVAVDVARINADTAVKLAEINADTTKKTDGTFIVFYLVRGLMWAAGALVVALVGWVVWWELA